MTLSDFYLFCFLFGFLFSFVTVVSGHLHIDFHDHGHHLAGHHDVSPFNMGTISAFLAWFGGTGYLFTRFYTIWFVAVLLAALAAGVVGGWIVYWFLTRILMRQKEAMDPSDYEMIGVLGQVTSAIRPAGVGEILYTRDGARRAVAARSESGNPITSGEEVVVMRYENGIAYVRRWNELIG